MRKIITTLLLALCFLMPAAADYYDPYMSVGTGLSASADTDYTLMSFNYQLDFTTAVKIGGFVNPDFYLYGVGTASFPFVRGLLYTQMYDYTPDAGRTSLSLGMGFGFVLDDGWHLALEAGVLAKMPDVEDMDGAYALGGTLRLIPTRTIVTAREWLAMSLTLPITIQADVSGVSAGFGIGFTFDINDHAVNS